MKSSPSIPKYPHKSLHLGHHVWHILVVPRLHPKLGKGTWGKCYWDEHTIYIQNNLGQKNFEITLAHELIHVMMDNIGFHDKMVSKFKTAQNEKFVDGMAHQLARMIRPQIFHIPTFTCRTKGVCK